jgi:hypothetical protein
MKLHYITHAPNKLSSLSYCICAFYSASFLLELNTFMWGVFDLKLNFSSYASKVWEDICLYYISRYLVLRLLPGDITALYGQKAENILSLHIKLNVCYKDARSVAIYMLALVLRPFPERRVLSFPLNKVYCKKWTFNQGNINVFPFGVCVIFGFPFHNFPNDF